MNNRAAQLDSLHVLLEKKFRQYNTLDFIADDPISIPHRFKKKQDIEIIGFWIAVLSWGNRKSIIRSGERLIGMMDGAPHEFILNHQRGDLKHFETFAHRTFNGEDALFFLKRLRKLYQAHNSMEELFLANRAAQPMEAALINFNRWFFDRSPEALRTRKHVATPERNSTCKRMNMFLRWMVRSDEAGVDFGLWKNIKPSQLVIPLDVHVERIARQLGFLTRKQRDWQAALELTETLRKFDANDPVKYDYALFGMGVSREEI